MGVCSTLPVERASGGRRKGGREKLFEYLVIVRGCGRVGRLRAQ